MTPAARLDMLSATLPEMRPAALSDRLPELLGKTLAQLTGGAPSPEGGVAWARPGAEAALAIAGGRAADQETLARRGYTRARRFVALPSAGDPRWLLPLGDDGRVRGGLQIYTPYSPLARGLKGVTLGLLRAGWKGWRRSRVLVASRGPLAVERLVAEVTGERRPAFALALGAPGRYRKLTVQVMRPDGEILGYLKFPLNAAAGERIRHEAAMLEGLWQYPELRPHLPRVWHAGAWDAGNWEAEEAAGDEAAGRETAATGYVLFQSSGPADAGGVRFGPAHGEFLRRLWGARRADQAGGAVVERTAARWRAVTARLPGVWRELGRETLRRAAAQLDGRRVACGILHGDFAPWNTRGGSGRLFVYDWEAADWEAPLGWDIFHFHVQVASLLRRAIHRPPVPESAGGRASFWLYLLHSACLGLEEREPTCPGVDFRRELLLTELRQAG